MKYSQTFNSDKTLLPKVSYSLALVPEILVFGSKHPRPMRAPGAIFNIAFGEVVLAIEKLYDTWVENADKHSEREKLLESQTERLFYHMCSFYDEMFLVLIAMSPPSKENPNFAYDWLKQNGYNSGNVMKSSCSDLIKPWQEVNNRLKHNNQKLSRFTLKDREVTVEGTFVEGVTDDGAIAPDPTIHGAPSSGLPQAL